MADVKKFSEIFEVQTLERNNVTSLTTVVYLS